MSLWRERYAEMEAGRVRFKKEIAVTAELVGKTMDEIERVKGETVEKKKDIVRQWPLTRRLGRALGLLPYDLKELAKVTESIKALDQWFQELSIVRRLLTVTLRSVSQLYLPLTDLAANVLNKDVTFRHGDGLPKMQALYSGIKSRAYKVRKSVSSEEALIDGRQT
ncbi:hypothetical protein XANCAGTX0491_004936 [Xanthoria calcicola]